MWLVPIKIFPLFTRCIQNTLTPPANYYKFATVKTALNYRSLRNFIVYYHSPKKKKKQLQTFYFTVKRVLIIVADQLRLWHIRKHKTKSQRAFYPFICSMSMLFIDLTRLAWNPKIFFHRYTHDKVSCNLFNLRLSMLFTYYVVHFLWSPCNGEINWASRDDSTQIQHRLSLFYTPEEN